MWYDGKYFWSVHFDNSLGNLDLDSRLHAAMLESKNFSPVYLTKLWMDLEGMWYAVETFWSGEPHSHFISSN